MSGFEACPLRTEDRSLVTRVPAICERQCGDKMVAIGSMEAFDYYGDAWNDDDEEPHVFDLHDQPCDHGDYELESESEGIQVREGGTGMDPNRQYSVGSTCCGCSHEIGEQPCAFYCPH